MELRGQTWGRREGAVSRIATLFNRQERISYIEQL